jgi:predicted acylesterase/phospholipase RssA
MNKDWVLICQGGGGKGSWEAGFIYELGKNAGFSFKTLIGTSIGSINSALYLQCLADKSFQRLKNLWFNVESDDIFKLDLANLISQGSLSNQGRLREILQENIDPQDINKIINKQKKLLYIDSSDYKKNNFYPFQFYFGPEAGGKDDISLLINILLASSSMPVFYPPLKYRGMLLYDGGLCATNPLHLLDGDPESQKVIVLSPLKKGSLSQVSVLDFWEIQVVHRIINMQKYLVGLAKKPEVHFIVPGKKLATSVVDFNKDSCKTDFALGQDDAKEFADNLKFSKEHIWQYNWRVLQEMIGEALVRVKGQVARVKRGGS